MKIIAVLFICLLSGCATLRHPDSITVSENLDQDEHHAGNQIFAGWNWK